MLKCNILKNIAQLNKKIQISLLGPAFVTATGYIDPGNFATNIQSGAFYGYKLLWVVVLANIMAMLIQLLSAKLGIATNKNLAEHIRDNYSKPIVWLYWIQAEIIAIATDLAEFIGASIGFKLIFNINLLQGALLTSIATYLILMLQNKKKKLFEIISACFLLFVALAYIIELFFTKPKINNIIESLIFPSLPTIDSILLSAGILGATIMPHVIYLHSSLTQNHISNTTKIQRYASTKLDISIAMTLAGFVNLAIMTMAASAFHEKGHIGINNFEEAYLTLEPLFNRTAAIIFGISLLVAGLSSTVVGTLSGQVIMQGFMKFYIPIWFRRIFTILPSLFFIAFQFDIMHILVMSQVTLSFGITFALVPLLIFTSSKKVMGNMVNSYFTKNIGKLIVFFVCSLNIYLLINTLFQ